MAQLDPARTSPLRAAALGMAALAVALAGGDARAEQTFVVNSIADVPANQNDIYDGVCETAPGNGVCTLRAAVMEANRQNEPATIRLPAGIYYLTIPETEESRDEAGDLELQRPMTIIGEGPSATIVDGSDMTRVFFASAQDVVIRDLAVANGNDTGVASGITNWTDLVLENVRVTSNRGAGGIYNQGTLVMRHCRVDGNEAGNAGGGLENREWALVQDSIFEGNSAYYGGGISSDGHLVIERTSILGNFNTGLNGEGGGVRIQDSPFVENPGLWMINSDVFANSTNESGGGIYVYDGAATLVNVTVTSNLANSDGDGIQPITQGGPAGGGIGIDRVEASIFLKNSIVYGNHSNWENASGVDDDCGPLGILSGDYNIRGWLRCYLTGQTAHVNMAELDPELDAIDMNGGFGLNLASTNGPGYDVIPAASCTDLEGATLETDFRGARRGPGNCDIGAHEAFALYAPESPLGAELVRNGGGAGNEIGEALSDWDPTFDRSAPYWFRSTGKLLPILYGKSSGYPVKADAPPGSGNIFFSGGNNPVSFAKQEIDVSALASQIDAGDLRYRASGAFGGYATDDDNALMTVSFRSASDDLLDTITLGGFDAADRGNATKLLPDSRTGFVPVGTRSAQVSITATRASGASNDGYSDDISLVLPEPGSIAAAAVAAAVLRFRARARARS